MFLYALYGKNFMTLKLCGSATLTQKKTPYQMIKRFSIRFKFLFLVHQRIDIRGTCKRHEI